MSEDWVGPLEKAAAEQGLGVSQEDPLLEQCPLGFSWLGPEVYGPRLTLRPPGV